MELLLVSGMSGAGKTQALRTLEDMGYYCVDNLPPQLLLYLLETEIDGMARDKIAITMDIRAGGLLSGMDKLLRGLRDKNTLVRVLYLDASDERLKNRYRETRRLHPLIQSGDALDLSEAIALEREKLSELRSLADIVVDTSHFQTSELKNTLIRLFADANYNSFRLEFVSFGFKYGILADADLVFDVRCLPNPFYVERLRRLTGADEEVRAYIFGTEEGRAVFDRIRDLLELTIPMYQKEGKSRLVVGFGCTGGQHRSVAFAGMMKEYFEKEYPSALLTARDMAENRFEINQRFSSEAEKRDIDHE